MDSQKCHIMAHRDIIGYYDAFKTAISLRKDLPKSSQRVEYVHERLMQHDREKHSVFVPTHTRMTPIKRVERRATKRASSSSLSSTKATRTRVISPQEQRVQELSHQRDHDTSTLFDAILAYKSSCAADNEKFLEGLALYPRAIKLWTTFQYESDYQVDSTCNHLVQTQQRSNDIYTHHHHAGHENTTNTIAMINVNRMRAGPLAMKLAFRERTMEGRLSQIAIAQSIVESAPLLLHTPSQMVMYHHTIANHKALLAQQMKWDEDYLLQIFNRRHDRKTTHRGPTKIPVGTRKHINEADYDDDNKEEEEEEDDRLHDDHDDENQTKTLELSFIDRSLMDTIYVLIALAPFITTKNLILEAIELAETFSVRLFSSCMLSSCPVSICMTRTVMSNCKAFDSVAVDVIHDCNVSISKKDLLMCLDKVTDRSLPSLFSSSSPSSTSCFHDEFSRSPFLWVIYIYIYILSWFFRGS